MRTLLCFLLLLPSVCFAQDPPVVPDVPTELIPVASIEVSDSNGNTITSEVPIGEMIVISSRKAVHAHKTGSLTWRIRPSLQSFTAQDGETLVLNTGLKPQVVEILQIVSLGDRNAYQELSIRIGNAPNPPPDVDPDPEPEPTPVIGKLYVAIIEEVADRPTLPPGQQSIFTAKEVRDYRDRACAKHPEDGTPEWKILDKDLDVSKEPEWIKKAFSEQRTTLPWIVFSNGKQGYSGPLPGTVIETLELLKKYGGP